MKSNKKNKPPVVVVLGHVDHGKSSLLEAIKDLKITQKESGGITQHIGAYFIEHENKGVTFIDTPGHEAFSAMRSRGTTIADVAVLVVACDDGVKEQTKEAIEHVRKTKTPFVVALNKIDKKEANPERTKQMLASEGVFVESFGGDTPSVEVSAEKRKGIDELLEMILLVAEMEELQCKKDVPAKGSVIESKVNKKKGASATLLVEEGTLQKGDVIGTESCYGTVRTMEDCTGEEIEKAGPSRPVSIIGVKGCPHAGERFEVHEKLSEAKKSIPQKEIQADEQKPEVKEFPVVVKADTFGSLEAIKTSIDAIPRDKVFVRVIRSGVGNINENDADIAKAAGADIFSFHVKTDNAAKNMILRDNINVRNFDVIYELLDGIKKEASKIIEPEKVRTEIGKIKLLAVFRTKGNRQILGGKIIKGEALKGALAEVWRENEKRGEGKVVNLKKEEKDIERAPEREEIGLLFEGSCRAEEGDVIFMYKEEEIVISL